MKFIILTLLFIKLGMTYPYPDKKYRPSFHVGCSALALAGSYYLLPPGKSRLSTAYMIGFTVGALKEFFDASTNGKVDIKDMAWNQIGLGIGVGVVVSIDNLIRR